MSYIQIKIGTKDVLKECRLVHVPAGQPVPTPATGYQLSAKIYTEYGADFYLEYKEIVSNMVLV